MSQTPTELQARSLIRRGLEILFHDPEHAREYDDMLGCAQAELDAVWDGWLANEAVLDEEAIQRADAARD